MAELGDRVRRTVGGIRTRVVVGYLLLAAVTMVASLVVIRQVMRVRLDDDIEQDLVQEVDELRVLAERGVDRITGEPLGDDVGAVFDTYLETSVPGRGEAYFTLLHGKPYRYSADAPAELLSDPEVVERWAAIDTSTRMVLSTEAGEARTLAVPMRAGGEVRGVFVATSFPREALEDLDATLRSIALTTGVVFLVAAAGAWTLAGRVLSPVRELTATARRISHSDLSARIPVEGHDELAELGRTFNEMVERLESGTRAQREFLDSVAHELRTPLTIARGHLEVAALEAGDSDATQVLVTEELDRMARYVDDLLVLAKAQEPDFLRFEPTDLGELVESLRQRAETLGARRWLVDDSPAPGMVAVVADAGRLQQAMLNLMTNAVQHTAEGDEIGIGARVDDGHAELWVRDTGVGVSPDLGDEIFERAVRGPGSRRNRPEGTGIGLSIVQTITHAHRGSVAVSDTPGGGATFTITIPTEPEDEK